MLLNTVNGNPDLQFVIAVSSHPFTSVLAKPWNGAFGICHAAEKLNTLGTSSLERP